MRLRSSLLLLGLATSGPPGEDPLPELLAGVSELAAPGAPGGLCVFGPEAFVVAVGRAGVPIVGAAEVGGGRIVALAHDGYLDRAALAGADTGRFFRNALRWLCDDRRPARVVCPGRAELVKAVDELGFQAEDTAELAGADCIVLDGHQPLTRARQAELQGFVRRGGGLLVAATGWGWQQLNASALLARDLPGNRLLVPFGLGFSLESVEKTSESGFAVGAPPDPLCHAGRALEALRRREPEGPLRELALARVRAALAALPDHEPQLVLPLRRLLEPVAGPEAGDLAALAPDHAARAWRPLGERWGEWQALGPFAHPRGNRDVTPAHAPEKELTLLVHDAPGPDLGAVFGTRDARTWRPAEVAGDGCELDVGVLRLEAWWPREETQRAAAYLYRRVELDEARRVSCRLGSDDGLRFWCNGELLADRNGSQGVEVDELSVELQLQRGVNHLVAKVTNEEGLFGFRLRLDEPRDQEAVSAAIDRGIAYLLERQQVDGSWEGWPEYGPGYTAFCVYTLLKCGVRTDHPAVRRGFAFLDQRTPAHTYSQACLVLALAAAGTPEADAALPAAVAGLVEMQERIGLYSYPIHPGHSGTAPDLSNTLMAALAFRAAAAKGAEVDEAVWRRLVEGTLLCWRGNDDVQSRRGTVEPAGFSYYVDSHPTGSMTTAGISVLQVAREALGKRLDRRLEKDLDGIVESGLAWLEHNWTWAQNPGEGNFHFFFLYGVERLGSLLGRDVIGKVNWYWSGAEYLVQRQNAEGGWKAEGGGEEKYDTPLALLFLTRATAPLSGARHGTDDDLFAAEGPEFDVSVRGKGGNPLTLWITGYGERARRELVWPGEREPRVAQARYVARRDGAVEELVLAEIAPAAAGGAVQRFESRVDFPGAGLYDVRAVLDVLRPPASQGATPEPESIESGVLRVRVPEAAGPAVLAYPRDAGRNLLRGAPKVEESSHYGDQAAAAAIDGLHGTRWHCDIADDQPWWRVTLVKPVEADGLLFSHAWPRALDGGKPQPALVEVLFDEVSAGRVEIDPNPLKKSELRLPAPRKVRSVEVRILGSRDRTLGRDAVGFSEIELVLGR